MKKILFVFFAVILFLTACDKTPTEIVPTVLPTEEKQPTVTEPVVEPTKTEVVEEKLDVYFDMASLLSKQVVGDAAAFGWNLNGANFVIKSIGEKNYIGRNVTDYCECFFEAKENGEDLTDFSFEVLVKPSDVQTDEAIQLFVGTNIEKGRYSVLIYPQNGGNIKLYQTGILATSNDELGKTVSFETGKTTKVVVSSKKNENDTSDIIVIVDDVVVLTYTTTELVTGDYGVSLGRGVNALLGNIKVSNFDGSVVYTELKNLVSSQKVGDVLSLNSNYGFVLRENGSNVFIGHGAYTWQESWFWAKTSKNENPESWSYSVMYKPNSQEKEAYTQLFFGTASEGGRFALLVDPNNGGAISIWSNGKGANVANSWEENAGATLNLGSKVELGYGKESKISIHNELLDDQTSKIYVLVDDVVVLTYKADVHIIGDFGFGFNPGVDAWVGNCLITEFDKETVEGLDLTINPDVPTDEPTDQPTDVPTDNPVELDVYLDLNATLANQNVGDVADFGWNIHGANYIIKEKESGIYIGPSAVSSNFQESWFWVKNSEDQNPTSWTYETDIKPIADNGGLYAQLLFGTASVNGRYALLVDVTHGSISLFNAGANDVVANSWEAEKGGTLKLGSEVTIEMNKVSTITIHNELLSNNTANLYVLVDGVVVLTYNAPSQVIGDFGIAYNEGVDALIGNLVVTELDKEAVDSLDLTVKPSEPETPTPEEPVELESYLDLNSLLENVSVGEIADFGWNIHGAKYVVKDKTNGIFIGPSATSPNFQESWFWVKDSLDQNPTSWSYTLDVKPLADNGGLYMQILFGTASSNGRYALLVDVTHGSISLFNAGANDVVANSWEAEKGGTLKLGSEVTIEMNKISTITIHNELLSNNKANIYVLVDGVLVLTYNAPSQVIGDFGIAYNSDVDGWIGNLSITELDKQAVNQFKPSVEPDDSDEPTIEEPVELETYLDLNSTLANVSVGSVADFGWNIHGAKYIVKDKSNGIFIGPSAVSSNFQESWFWVKNSEDQNPTSWTYEIDVKPLADDGGLYLQLLFGTASSTGRYALLVDVTHGSIGLYCEGSRQVVANSWEAEMGGTLKLGSEVTIEMNKISKITIHNELLSNNTANIYVLVDGVLVLTYNAPAQVIGDFGIAYNSGVDAWVGNLLITELNQQAVNKLK